MMVENKEQTPAPKLTEKSQLNEIDRHQIHIINGILFLSSSPYVCFQKFNISIAVLHRLKIEPSTLGEFMLCVCARVESVEHKTYSFRRLFCKPIVVYHPSSLFFTRFHSSNVYLSLLGCYPYTHMHTCTHTPLCYSHPYTRRGNIFPMLFLFLLACS